MPLPFQPKPLDADAAAYIARSGATDRAAINAFVRGVKALGLWNNMVCWPLRSSQNAGFGSTAYSLGGLGTFNGTLVNAPGWTADGLTATTTNSYVQTQLPITLSTIGAFSVVGVGNIVEGVNKRLVGSNGSTAYLFSTSSTNNPYSLFDGINTVAVTNSTNNTQSRWVALTKNNSLTFEGYVGSDAGLTRTVASLRASSDNLALFGSNGTSLAGVYPFFAFANVQMLSEQNAALYSLYKSTLGAGLGLP